MLFYLIVALFITLGLAILFGSHYFLYFSLIHFFPEITKAHNETLAGVISFLAISFILFSIIAHVRESFLARIFYFLSGFWLGFLTNLVMATAVIWIIISLNNCISFSLNLKILGTIFYVSAFLFSLYGVWNAMHPKIKSISITIPNLPDRWKNKKIIQLSDLHIGHIHKDSFIKNIVKKVNFINPDLIAITGDLFDGMDGNFDFPLKIINEMNPRNGIFFVTGNHETFLNTKIIFSALEKTKIKVLHDEVLNIDGLNIIGINYPEHGETKDAIEVIEKLKPQFFGKPNIFLYHTPVNIDKFRESGINLMLSGHTHRGQLFPFQLITKLLFKGFDYGLHTVDKFTIYVTSGAGTWGPAMRTGNRPEIVVISLK